MPSLSSIPLWTAGRLPLHSVANHDQSICDHCPSPAIFQVTPFTQFTLCSLSCIFLADTCVGRIYRLRYVLLMVASTWLVAFASMVPTWIGYWGRFGLDASVGSCSILYNGRHRSPKVVLFSLAFLVPFCCIFVCYTRIYWLVRKSARCRPQRRPYRWQRSVESAVQCTLGDKLQIDFIEINRSLQTPPIEYSEKLDNPLDDCKQQQVNLSGSNETTHKLR